MEKITLPDSLNGGQDESFAEHLDEARNCKFVLPSYDLSPSFTLSARVFRDLVLVLKEDTLVSNQRI